MEKHTQMDSRPLMSIHESQERSPKEAKRLRPLLRPHSLPKILHSQRKRGKPQDLETLNSQPISTSEVTIPSIEYESLRVQLSLCNGTNCQHEQVTCRVVLQKIPASPTESGSRVSTGNVVNENMSEGSLSI